MLRFVLDTNVLVAGLASRHGASFALIERLAARKLRLLVSTPLWLEYESVLKRPQIRAMHGLSPDEIDIVLDTLAMDVEPITLHFLWRPQLRDAGDEMVLELAVNGAADALITHTINDFKDAAVAFGLRVVKPADFLHELNTQGLAP